MLLHHPILWNLKVVPVIPVMLALHVIFFVCGYISGAVDFSEYNEQFYVNWPAGFAVFVGILLSILITVVWLVFYFRNNALKSYYPKQKSSLYREWLLIFAIATINVSYPLTFAYAKDVRARSYYDEAEVVRRTDIISMVSLFAESGFRENGDTIIDGKDGEGIQVHRDTFKYGGRYYPLKSMLNKTITDFSIQGHTKDSLNERRVKGWLVNNRKDSVLWLMTEFDKIAKEHGAVLKMTPRKWLEIVYDYPDFADYVTVGRLPYFLETENVTPYTEEVTFTSAELGIGATNDTVSNVVKVKGGMTYIYPKYYVPLKQVENSYHAISDAWADPAANGTGVLVCVCVGLVMSLLIFSFRVTSGRSWLIAMVAYGITALVIGICNLLLFEWLLRDVLSSRYDEEAYFATWLLILAGLMVYFLSVTQTRGISDVVLNVIIWLTPWAWPVIGMLLHTYFRKTAVYNDDNVRISPKSGLEVFVDDHPKMYLWLGIILYFVFMYFFTAHIKKWKGIAEA